MPNAVRILKDIPYGEARAGFNGGAGPMRSIALKMDAYLPDPRPARPPPAVLLAFGGAFHRGSKDNDAFPDAGAYGSNTAMADYCRRFAAEGFACFSVAYRLAGDDPDPGTTPVLRRPDTVPLSRVAQVREIMRLPPITPAIMAGVVEAAIDDVTAAARAVHARAAEFGVDPARLVLGGWSAGARCALYAAYAERVPCAGVLALSGTMMECDIDAYVMPSGRPPPLLLVAAGQDVDYIRDGAGPMVEAMRTRGCDARLVSVPNRDHWYAAEAVTADGGTVQQALREALRRWTGA
jgi:dienelactone hydrolase